MLSRGTKMPGIRMRLVAQDRPRTYGCVVAGRNAASFCGGLTTRSNVFGICSKCKEGVQ